MRITHLAPAIALIWIAACGGDAFVAGSGGSGDGGNGTGTGTGTTGSSSSSGTSSGTGSGASPQQCSGPGECVLVSETCCGVCGMPELDDMVALDQTEVDAHFAAVCADPVSCPDCPTAPNPDLMAYCDGGTCVGADIGQHPFGSCQQTSDCKLRWGLTCCECGSEGMGLTAIPVAFETQLQSLVCLPDSGCLECAPAYPSDAAPFCDNGHCKVIYANGGPTP